jgi:hypothetical protein
VSHQGSNIERSPHFGELQAVVNSLFGQDVPEWMPDQPTVSRLDVVIAAEIADLPDDLIEIVERLPPGNYTRLSLCTQLNSSLTGHALGQVYGTVV